MKTIALKHGMVYIIDDEDYSTVLDYWARPFDVKAYLESLK